MGIQPTFLGNVVLAESFRCGPSAGLLPFRAVCLDNTVTPTNYGTNWLPPVKNPNRTFAALEAIIGVITDPVAETVSGTIDTIAQNRFVTVRMFGTVPVISDSSVVATPIRIGDYVASSSVASMDGRAARATRTGNVIDTAQHVMGVALTPSSASGTYTLIKIQPADY